MLKETSTRALHKISQDEYNFHTPATIYGSKDMVTNDPSNVSLSTAAAVAALRSQPMGLTSITDLSTKRTLRRVGSTPSQESAKLGLGRSRMQRRMSSGSMSERSFRELSQTRSHFGTNVNLIPALPKISKHQIDPSVTVPSISPLTIDAKCECESQIPSPGLKRISIIQEVASLDRRASRESINFSLPTGSRSTSPVAKKHFLPSKATHLNKASLIDDYKTKNVSVYQNIENKVSLYQSIGTNHEKDPITHVSNKNSGIKPSLSSRLPIYSKTRDISSSNIYELAANVTPTNKAEQTSRHQKSSIPRSPQVLGVCDVNRKILNQISKTKTQPGPSTWEKKIDPKQKNGPTLSSGAKTQDLSHSLSPTDQNQVKFLSHLSHSPTRIDRDQVSASRRSLENLPESRSDSNSMFFQPEKRHTLEKTVTSDIKIDSQAVKKVDSPIQSKSFTVTPTKIATKYSLLPSAVSSHKSALKRMDPLIQRNISPDSSIQDLSESSANVAFSSTTSLDCANFDENKSVTRESTSHDSNTVGTIKSINMHSISKNCCPVENEEDLLRDPLPASVLLDSSCVEKIENSTDESSNKVISSIYERNTTEKLIKSDGTGNFISDIHGNSRSTHTVKIQIASAKTPDSDAVSGDTNIKAQLKLENSSRLTTPANINSNNNLQDPTKFVASTKKDWLRIPGAWESLTEITYDASSFFDSGKTDGTCESEARVLSQFDIETVDSVVEESDKTEGSETESIYSNAVENISDLEDYKLASLNAAVDSFNSKSVSKSFNSTLMSHSPLPNSDVHTLQSSIPSNYSLESSICKQNIEEVLKDEKGPNQDVKEKSPPESGSLSVQSRFTQISGEAQSSREKYNTFKDDPNFSQNPQHGKKSNVSTTCSVTSAVDTSKIKSFASLRPARKLPRVDGSRELPQNKYERSASSTTQPYSTNSGSKVSRRVTKDGPEQPVPLRRKTSHGSISSFKRALSVREPMKFRKSMRGPSDPRTPKVVPISTQLGQSSLPVNAHELSDSINRRSLGSPPTKLDTYKPLRNSSYSSSSKLLNLRVGRLSFESYNNTSGPTCRADLNNDEAIKLPSDKHSHTEEITKMTSRRSKLWSKGDLHGIFKHEKIREKNSNLPHLNDVGPTLDRPCDISSFVRARDISYSPHLISKKTARKTSRNHLRQGLKHPNTKVASTIHDKGRVVKKIGFKQFFKRKQLNNHQPEVKVNSYQMSLHENKINDAPWPFSVGTLTTRQSTDGPYMTPAKVLSSPQGLTNSNVQDRLTHTSSSEPVVSMNITTTDQKKKKFVALRRMFKMTD